VKTVIDSPRLPEELSGWAGRGGLCAIVSFVWALVLGFSSLFERAGLRRSGGRIGLGQDAIKAELPSAGSKLRPPSS